MLLIQDVDAIPFLQFIFHQQKYVDVSVAEFGITKTKEIIPNPKVCFKFSYHVFFIILLYYVYGIFIYTYSIHIYLVTFALNYTYSMAFFIVLRDGNRPNA